MRKAVYPPNLRNLLLGTGRHPLVVVLELALVGALVIVLWQLPHWLYSARTFDILVRPGGRDVHVWMDGCPIQTMDNSSSVYALMRLGFGRHRLKASKPGYATREKMFTVRPSDNDSPSASIKLQKLPDSPK